jgi:hypothetical protein
MSKQIRRENCGWSGARRSAAALVLACGSILGVAGPVAAQTPLSTAFTYQGELRNGGNPVSGTADVRFRLYNAASGGSQIGSEIDVLNVAVGTNGRFTTSLDFGAWGDQARWLEIDARSPAGSGSYTTLTPRQAVTAAPVAAFALSGNPGPTGPAGATGSQGIQGVQGVPGPTGSQGNQGVQGVPGPTGAQGIQGIQGSQGVPGPTGATGASPWQLSGTTTFYNAGFVGVGRSARVTTNEEFGLFSPGPGYGGMYVQTGSTSGQPFYGYDTSGGGRWWTYLDGSSNSWRLANNGVDVFSVQPSGSAAVYHSLATMTGGGIGDALSVGGGTIPMGLTTESGEGLPLLNLDMNFRDSTLNTSVKGGAVRLDGRPEWPTFQFITRPAGSTTETVALDVTEAGNVGIGTLAPDLPLVVASTTGENIRIEGPGSFTTLGRIRFQDNFGNVFIDNPGDGSLRLNASALSANCSTLTTNCSTFAMTGSNGGSISFPAVTGSPVPMITMFASGTSNADRMVIAHSSAYTNWGLQYQDAPDTFNFLSAGSPVLSVGLGSGRVGVGTSAPTQALTVIGNCNIVGSISKLTGSFKIDHPLDPENKYLYHSFVESPDMKNIYDGVVTTDGAGNACVELPDWFEALNRDFRYQLTVVDPGVFALARVSREVSHNSFCIATNLPNIKVSWQVTGIRQDAYANAHRIPVEEDKPESARGKYLAPAVFGQPEDRAEYPSPAPGLKQPSSAQR